MSAKNVYDNFYCYIAIKIIQKVGLQIIKCPVIVVKAYYQTRQALVVLATG